jgi:hypothetical protein
MENDFIYQKKASGKPDAITIADLIPFGRDNAITRKMLVAKCISCGLVDENLVDPDREMRRLIEKARVDYTILNLSDGNGYYRPSKDELNDLQKYIRQERNRAISAFKNIRVAQKLYEDYLHERKSE